MSKAGLYRYRPIYRYINFAPVQGIAIHVPVYFQIAVYGPGEGYTGRGTCPSQKTDPSATHRLDA
jgi:hypothetical protein